MVLLVRLSDYVDWCRRSGAEVGWLQSRHEYMGYLFDSGFGVVDYSPELHAFDLGVVSMSVRSEPLASHPNVVETTSETVEEFLDNLRRWGESERGVFRMTAVAGRFDDVGPETLWKELDAMTTSNLDMTYGTEHLALARLVPGGDRPVTAPQHDMYDAMRWVMRLAFAGRGLVSVAHRDPAHTSRSGSGHSATMS